MALIDSISGASLQGTDNLLSQPLLVACTVQVEAGASADGNDGAANAYRANSDPTRIDPSGIPM